MRPLVRTLLLLTLVALGAAQAQAPKLMRIGLIVPVRTGVETMVSAPYEYAGDLARMGGIMAGDEIGQNAELLGVQVKVVLASAPTAEAATRAAERLIATENVFALVGGIGPGQAEALAKVAQARRVLFFNIGNPSNALRGEQCNRLMFHVEASASMYLDALADWFVRSSFRRWFFVYPKTPEGQALYSRMIKAVTVRHWGAREVGKAEVVVSQPDFGRELEAIRRSNADVVLMLLGAEDQATFLSQYDGTDLKALVTAFPDPISQTRDYYSALRVMAPKSSAGFRATLWETTMDRYGARELNARFSQRWGQAMDAPAWAAYQSVKMLYETASQAQSVDAAKLVAYLENPQTVFDVHKGIGVSFRPWDHQLRQPMYLVKLNARSSASVELSKRIAMASLVGELPAIYRPGTSVVERLDQLGDMRRDSKCRFR
ncbi:MAG: ABC transporter substrate-binding protein [Meiothermus sp.]|nr:ABC transporter substrate-binding protein [Meiothermus sp.]